MATTLVQLSSQAGTAAAPGAQCPAWLPANTLASAVATPPYLLGSTSVSPGYSVPYLRFQKVSGVFANGDFIDDLLMPQGMGFPGMWSVVDYTANATPALAANLTLNQCGQDASYGLTGLNATQSISSGLASTASATTTPPYIVNNQAAPFMRFTQSQALAQNQVVVDLVMPNGHQNPGSFYVVRYTLNASLQLA